MIRRDPSELDLQLAVINERYNNTTIISNYTPMKGWRWEADLWEVTNSGYAVEYECKRTLSDFKADAKKRGKHNLLLSGDPRGPSRFWYVTPKGLLFKEHGPLRNPEAVIPNWAGLIEVWFDEALCLWRVETSKKAPRLHNFKVHNYEEIVSNIHKASYYRMHRLLQALGDRRYVIDERTTQLQSRVQVSGEEMDSRHNS